MKRNKRILPWLLVIALIAMMIPSMSFAEGEKTASSKIFNASDMEDGSIASITDVNGFTLNATAEKGLTVDASEKTSDKGVAFTKRLKLNGTGSAEARSISFTAAANDIVTVYAMSGSSASDRILGLYKADGTLVSEISALGVYADNILTATDVTITEAGGYYLASTSSGINVYYVSVAGEGSEDTTPRKAWAEVSDPVLNTPNTADGKIDVPWTMEVGASTDGADRLIISMYSGETLADEQTIAAQGTEGTATFTPSASGAYTFTAKAIRLDETDEKTSNTVTCDNFVYPLVKPEIKVLNGNSGAVTVKWSEVKEATGYKVEMKKSDDTEFTTAVENTTELEADIASLTVGVTYVFKVSALRGEEAVASDELEKIVEGTAEREWNFSVFGQSSNKNINTYELSADGKTLKLNSCTYKEDGTIDSKGGKFTTYHDGISYYYTVVDPAAENFELTATFTVDYINPTPDGQEGFGILARDSIGEDGVNMTNFMTNSATAIATKTSFDGASIKDGIGYRFVSGVTKEMTDTGIIGEGATSSTLGFNAETVKAGESYTLTLKKTNTGYHVIYNGEEKIMYNPEKLLLIDPDNVYVGFAVARGCNVTVTDIKMTTSDPATDAPAEEEPVEKTQVSCNVPSVSTTATPDYNYIFQANVNGTLTVKDTNGNTVIENAEIIAGTDFTKTLTLTKGQNTIAAVFTPAAGQNLVSDDPVSINKTVTYNVYDSSIIYASPNGTADGAGTKDSPLDIYTACAYVKAGQFIMLEAGKYDMSKTLKIERGNDGINEAPITMTTEDGRAILDFSSGNGNVQIWGSYWYISNIDVCMTGENIKGIQVAGHYNTLDSVNAYQNGDTGIQISGTGSESKDMWPTNNLILNCTSHDNCDPGHNNADGFAAKLTCGAGNKFMGCISYRNVDDGWDLFSKVESGAIEPVIIENSLCFSNGHTYCRFCNQDVKADGNGFKMGGDGIAVAHKLINSISIANDSSGVTCNSDPAIIVENVVSAFNLSTGFSFYGKGSTELTFEAKNAVSYKNGSDDTVDLASLYSAVNYFTKGGKPVNTEGVEVTEDMFVSTDYSNLLERIENGSIRNEDGSINMDGLMEFTDKAPAHLTDSFDLSGESNKSPFITQAKAQILTETTSDSSSTKMRIVAAVNGLEFKKAGFVVSTIDEKPELGKAGCKDLSSTKVYTSILANGNKITSEMLNGKYITTGMIINIPQNMFDTAIHVRPYVELLDGTIYYVDIDTFTVNDCMIK